MASQWQRSQEKGYMILTLLPKRNIQEEHKIRFFLTLLSTIDSRINKCEFKATTGEKKLPKNELFGSSSHFF